MSSYAHRLAAIGAIAYIAIGVTIHLYDVWPAITIGTFVHTAALAGVGLVVTYLSYRVVFLLLDAAVWDGDWTDDESDDESDDETVTFRYFDGRENAAADVTEHDVRSPGVDVQIDRVEWDEFNSRSIHAADRYWVDPPYRYAYPRPVESESEAVALYMDGEITERQLDGYLERLVDPPGVYDTADDHVDDAGVEPEAERETHG